MDLVGEIQLICWREGSQPSPGLKGQTKGWKLAGHQERRRKQPHFRSFPQNSDTCVRSFKKKNRILIAFMFSAYVSNIESFSISKIVLLKIYIGNQNEKNRNYLLLLFCVILATLISLISFEWVTFLTAKL